MRPSRSLPWSLAVGLFLLGGCGGGDDQASGERWIALARGHQPSLLSSEFTPGGPALIGGPQLVLHPVEGEAVWAVRTMAASEWSRHAPTGIWVAPRRFFGEGMPPDGSPPQRMIEGDLAWTSLSLEEAASALAHGAANVFCAAGDRLFAVGDSEGPPPDGIEVWEYISLGWRDGAMWRQRMGPITMDAIPVLPGLSEERVVDVPSNSVLRFATLVQGMPGATLRLRVRLNEETVFELEFIAALEVDVIQHIVELPTAGMSGARFLFEVEGDAALAAFGAPTIGPAEIGSYGSRPWEARPDIVVFLADTFRADNLAAYGGDPALTPHLDKFAANSLRFERAWSTSTWTLPSHAAMFTGLYPHQLVMVDQATMLPSEAVTVGEMLAAAGYRTGAVTDQGFVSQSYGLDQGFESFWEEWSTFDDTLAAARDFLDRDDGRPVFLFVHTYRTHTPYVVSSETRARIGEHLGLTTDFETLGLKFGVMEDGFDREHPDAGSKVVMEQLIALYRGTAADLDLGFHEFREELAERGLDNAWLIFTSDHGEGLFEHGYGGHGDHLFDEFLRVPFLVHGPGLAPGTVGESVTSVDLPSTLAGIAGLVPDSSWEGQNVLASLGERPALSFRCRVRNRPMVSLIEGPEKIIVPAVPGEFSELLHAFNLEADPGERQDVTASEWAAALLGRHMQLLDAACTQMFTPEAATLSAEARAELEALGYAGD